jgi:hypothetical protein
VRLGDWDSRELWFFFCGEVCISTSSCLLFEGFAPDREALYLR